MHTLRNFLDIHPHTFGLAQGSFSRGGATRRSETQSRAAREASKVSANDGRAEDGLGPPSPQKASCKEPRPK